MGIELPILALSVSEDATRLVTSIAFRYRMLRGLLATIRAVVEEHSYRSLEGTGPERICVVQVEARARPSQRQHEPTHNSQKGEQ